ncbi:MAG TPA: NAD-dependent epimerase/dehydratase family protein [Nannocystaceae bacterium]|nr:NAD-dependent epimerase/dehydratase family protein [Nannocystaceae bacterium]
MGTIAIVGAGWLGTAIANALAASGAAQRVVATTRTGVRPVELAPAVELATLDVAAPSIAAIADADAWLVAIAPGRDRRPEQDRHALYVDGATRLLATLAHTSVRRVVWIGSTSALPDRDGDVDEHEASWPDEARGRIQREAEQIVAHGCAAANVSWMVLRMAGLYGPGRELTRIYARDGGPDVQPGDGMTATNLVHRDDAVTAAIAAIASTHQGIVHVVDDDHCPRRTMLESAARSLDRDPPRWELPPGDAIRGKRVTSSRLRSWLGVTLAHPHHGGQGAAR